MAEVKGKIGVTTENIFPVIKQFLYSDHEIFLRELVANAVDASEKMKALAASGGRREVAPHNGLLLQRRIAGQEQTVIKDDGAAPFSSIH